MSNGKASTDAETGNVLSSGNRNYSTKNYALSLKQPILNLALSKDVGKAKNIIDIGQINLADAKSNLATRVAERYF